MVGRAIPLLGAALVAGGAGASSAATPDFNREVRPILASQCFACHGPDAHERKGGLRLDTAEGAAAGGKSNRSALVPGRRTESELWHRLTSADPNDRMPPPETGHSLKAGQIETLGEWIDAGAVYQRHWSFLPPRKPPLPDSVPPAGAIDHLASARLAAAALTLRPRADAPTLLRRLSLDLTGLPPTLEQVDDFAVAMANDPGAAVDRAVDRLLASARFGERWARMWLDLARYADSSGYGSDPLRMNIWRYRDWVIDSFNRNQRYDAFTIEQLAGDLLWQQQSPESRNPDLLLATAFHRNTMTNTLGGTIDEEFRVAAVKDRTETTAQVWMGLTLRCAQCHTHKFDPITNEEYYRLFAIFNQTEDRDLPDEAPTAPTPTPTQRAEMQAIHDRIAAARAAMVEPTPEFLARQHEWERRMKDPQAGWTALTISQATARSGHPLTVQPDQAVTAPAPAAESDHYVVEASAPMPGVTGLRLEALPLSSLPGGGPGFAGSGNFVVSEIKVFERPNGSKATTGRFVRLELPGKQRLLHLAEVQIFSGGKNLAPDSKPTQSSIDYEGVPQRAVDGRIDGQFSGNSVTHTRMEDDPWWEADLGAEVPIEQIVIWNRTDSSLEKRLDGYVVKILAADRSEVFTQKPAGVPTPSRALAVDGRREIAIRTATASFEQTGFEASRAVDGNLAPDNGWAIGPRGGAPHQLVLEFAEPVCAQPGCSISLEIGQHFPGHTIGNFRLSATAQPAPLRALPAALSPVLAKPSAERNGEEAAVLTKFYSALDPAVRDRLKEIAGFEQELTLIKPPETPVMRERPSDNRRETRLMVKGNYLVTDQVVTAGVPAAFSPIPTEAGAPNRLDLARWLVSRENPLTARVMVNRLWSQLFGRGLVLTEEDFGTQGSFPTHPELLDWLAVEFMDSGWDVKHVLKLIVLSATYQQSSEVTPGLLEKDPENLLLSRGPRFRLDAETVRDQALAISGLLSAKMFGPSVYPPQPDGIWRAAFNGERTYPTSTGEDRYRRGLYVFLRRTAPNPSMATFDAPNRELCTMRRIRTNTPLQAFVTLNDPAYVEMAQALARRLAAEGGATPEDRVKFGLRLCLLRDPPPEKLQTLLSLYQSELTSYVSRPAEAKKLAQDPLHPLPEATTNWPEQAALTVIANVLLNLDAILMKG